MSMMKKEFIKLADVLRKYPNLCRNDEALSALAQFCQSCNPRFNKTRWYDYIDGVCGPHGGHIKL